MMQVGLSNYQFGNSNVVARANNKKAEKKTDNAGSQVPGLFYDLLHNVSFFC